MTTSPPLTCSAPLLCSLHRLPVTVRIVFSISSLTYKTVHEKQPVHLHSILATSLPSRSLRSVSRSPRSRPTQVKSISLLFPVSLEKPPAVYLFSPFSYFLQETSQDTSVWLGLPPIDTGTPDGPLMLRNCFIDFAVEY